MKMAHRFSGPGKPYEGLTRQTKDGPLWTGEVRFVPDMLDKPLRRKKPTTWFVNSMSDLFHPGVTNEQVAAVFGVMAACPQHTFQVLTKRPERLPKWFRWYEGTLGAGATPLAALYEAGDVLAIDSPGDWAEARCDETTWPLLPNVHIGVSVEDQATADERIPLLLQAPAAVRWVSAEPLLGPVDIYSYLVECVGCDREGKSAGGYVTPSEYHTHGRQHLDWIVIGGESGPGARPCDVAWIRSLIDQCREAEVPAFVKQLGAHYVDAPNGVGGVLAKPDPQVVPPIWHLRDRKGGDMSEWPEDLRVREMPR
jgi:protein gp37